MSARPPSSPADAADEPPSEHPMRQSMIQEAKRRLGFPPYDWQLNDAENRLDYKDTLTLAGTSAGKTLSFALIAMILEMSITWILAPLNYIQEQQVETFEEWGISAVCVNQNTRWKQVKEDILRGRYQIVILSPEAFLDVDKLRNVVTAPELEDRRHFVVVDEAHVIHTWSEEFRKAYGHVGNLRAMLFNVPFTAATATATDVIQSQIISSLQLGSQLPLVVTNLGNFRPNIEHSVYRMRGGANSYEEITHFFPNPDDVGPTLIFVDSVNETTIVADVLRQHLGWTGDLAQRVRAYHSNRAESGKSDAAAAFKNGECKILVATEALTMGCDFVGVTLVIQYGAPDSLVTYVQRIGRGGRSPGTRARGIMMVTASQYEAAVKKCAGSIDMKPDDFVDPKVELDEDAGDALGDIGIADGAIDNVQEDQPTSASRTESSPTLTRGRKRRTMDLEVARFITCNQCYTKILDRIFRNPPHVSCYEAGTCSLCAARKARDESSGLPDVRAMDRAVKREQLDPVLDAEDEELVEAPRKRKSTLGNRGGDELRRYKEHLRAWRRRKFKDVSQTQYTSLEDIATDKALDAIARSRTVTTLESFDRLEPQWPQRQRWGKDVLNELADLAAEITREKQEKEEERERDKQERKAAKEAAKAAEKAAKEVEKAKRESEKEVARRLKAAEQVAIRRQQAAEQEAIQRQQAAMHTAPLTPARRDTFEFPTPPAYQQPAQAPTTPNPSTQSLPDPFHLYSKRQLMRQDLSCQSPIPISVTI